jgi:hypothetical protein
MHDIFKMENVFSKSRDKPGMSLEGCFSENTLSCSKDVASGVSFRQWAVSDHPRPYFMARDRSHWGLYPGGVEVIHTYVSVTRCTVYIGLGEIL